MRRREDLNSIAIIGIGCRLPGGIASPRQFWELLCNGGDAIREVPAERWDTEALFAADPAAPGRTYARRGGFVNDIDQFDAEFFGISPREAAHVDPQQRLLLETAHEAMEDAGERWDAPGVRNTGVFVGVFIHDYQHMQFADREMLGAHTGTGTAMSIAANRISYAFDLHGPSMAVDTACSSSLVAVDLACKALLNGDCDYALAGGVNVILKPEMTIAMSKATMLSRDGSCKSFDSRADGYVRGEGAGLVVLRRLSDARAARSSIYAVIRGSGVNSDGKTNGISVPNGDAQEALTRRVLTDAGVEAASVGYVEAHGTGTPVGDPIEAAALGRVFSEGRGDAPVLLGSVKTNIGHLESASGAAGLIKAALCLQHAQIPRNLHFENPNPAIDFDRLKLRVVTQTQDWPADNTPRRAAVNSFGFGGTNAHVVLEQAPDEPDDRCVPDRPLPRRIVLPMGAHNAAALQALASTYATYLTGDGHRARDLLYTVSQRRSHGSYRAALVANDVGALREQLDALAQGTTPEGAAIGRRDEAFSGRPVFVFSGMGPQWWAMGRELLTQEPTFRHEVDRIDAKLSGLTGWSIVDRLLADESASRIHDTDVAQPAIFAIQAGLAALWKHWGVEPGAVMGHSVGEVAALYAAGVLGLDDAVSVVYHRSRLQRARAGTGSMLAISSDVAEAARLIRGHEGAVAIAAINSPHSLTLSGDTAVLRRIHAQLEAEGTFARMLQVEVPYHSPGMDPIREELIGSLRAIRPAAPGVRYYSTVDADPPDGALGDHEYWWRNVRQTVRFASAMAAAIEDGHVCFLEIGPHPVLRTSIQECLAKRNVQGTVVSSLRRDRSDLDTMAAALGELHVAGATIAWETVVGPGDLVRLPPYPWQRSRHWAESEHAEDHRKGLAATSMLRLDSQRHPLLGSKLDLPAPTWLHTLRLSESTYIKDHKVQGTVVFPGTGYLEMALQTLAHEDAPAGAEPSPGEYLLLSDVEIGRALYLGDNACARLETARSGDRWAIHGCTGDDGIWIRHASGRCRREAFDGSPEDLDLDAVKAWCTNAMPADYGYRLFRDVGLEYGPDFRAIEELWYGPQQALARLVLPATLASPAAGGPGFLFHPAMLDACLHTLFGALNLNGEDSDRRGNVFLPVSVRQLRVYGRPTRTLWSHARLHARASQHFEADVRIYDDNHKLVAEVLDLRCQALEHPSTVAKKRAREWMLEYHWDAAPLAAPGAELGGRWLVLAPDARHPLISLLRARGADCVVAVPGDERGRDGDTYIIAAGSSADFGDLLSSVSADGAGLRGIVHAWALPPDDAPELGARWDGQELGAGSLLHLVQALAALRDGGHGDAAAASPPLWVLTEHTEPVLDSDPIRVAHSTLWGLRRVVANEYPYLSARIVDIDGAPGSLAALADELPQAHGEDELAFRRGVRHVHRLRRHLPDDAAARQPPSALLASPRKELTAHRAGDLKSMGWIRLPELEIGEHEVEIAVAATALNFKDVMKATGLFPARLLEGNLWSRETLGMECAGRISRVGAKVKNVKPGDEVMALAPRSFASHAVTHSALVVESPGLDPEVAAGVPVAFLTAAVSLELLANLQPGERVLIHAASGGVGQAAIQIAQDIGAEIFATAGNDDKRALVRSLGVEHVFDSRSLRFAEDIREATGGEGVDVVLNSLAGDAITQSLSVLRDYGRFVEIGKMDLDRDFPLGLRPFTRCLSFHAVDLDRMLAQRVETCGRILRSIQDRLVQGRLRPLPVTRFSAPDIADAFYAMAGARHTGKLVVDLTTSVPVEDTASASFRADASYLVTGGLTGFGLQLAHWLASRGAGRLILLGRRGAQTPGAAEAITSLEALGARVQIERGDVASRDDIAQVLGRVPADMPLRGVFHAAAVLDDALIKNLDLERYRKTFGPKAAGAWILHDQTQTLPLDHFMCFSSMASVLGNQGSANYCAANAFVDALAHHRRRRGLAALTVNWGVIADVGMAADEDFYRQNLERNGLSTIHSSHCLELLGLLMATQRVQTTVCPIDFETWLRFNPAGGGGRLAGLLAAAGTKDDASRTQTADETALRASLAALDAQARVSLAQQTVRAVLAKVFRTDVEKIDVTRSLTALGADSLMAIEIKNRLEPLGLAMSVTQLLNRTSVTTLASTLLETLGYGATAGAAATSEPRDPTIGVDDHSSSWFVQRPTHRDAKVRLFCFPYAGGGAGVYHHWPAAFPASIDVLAVALPGRGLRVDEGNLESIAQAADAIIPEILPLLDRPFALFGHCMGAILMYEVAQRLQQHHNKTAAHIFASGCMAPHLYNSPIVHEQDDETFLDVLRLISFSGTRALIEDPELRTSMFPLLRGDFRSVVQYGGSFEMRAPLDSPITGLAADNDLFAAPKAMEAWSRYTARGYDLARLPGDHYFVESDRDTVIELVCARLAQPGEDEAQADLAPALPEIANVTWVKPDNNRLGLAPRRSHGHARPQPPEAGQGPTHVFCFPPACLRADEFPLPDNTGPDLVYTAVEWHGVADPTMTRTVDEMVNCAYAAVRGADDRRMIFYGHCLGAIVAYELALRLQREGLRAPEHLLVAGVVGPHMYVAPDAHRLPTDKLIELLGVLKYPFADRLKQDLAFRNDRIGMIRADLEAMALYQYQETDALGAPITAVSLRHDLWSYPLRTDTWKHHTRARCEVVQWDGDHYVSMRHPERIHELVRSMAAR